MSSSMRRLAWGLPWLLVVALVAGCSALRDDMRRTEAAFSEARYEDVRVWLAALEPRVVEMPREMRAQFYYYAGMTAARLNDPAAARHYLALCREEASVEGLGLSDERMRNLHATLEPLE